MNVLPSEKEIEQLHRKYSPAESVFELVWEHCKIVGNIALQLAETSGARVDLDLVRVGCLLHDIGVYPLYKSDGLQKDPTLYITHGIRGEEILKAQGYPEQLYRFASHHTGTGLTKNQIIADQLPLPHQDFMAETLEEELIMYADKFHSKTTPPRFNSYAFYKKYASQFGADSVESFIRLSQKFGKPDLQSLAATYRYELR